jgi:beta-lactamase superfamily II metal-dependent hydrolase
VDRRTMTVLAGLSLVLAAGCLGVSSEAPRDLKTYEIDSPTPTPTATPAPPEVRLTAVTLERGDATLIQQGNQTLLIDTGRDPNATRVRAALTRNGVDQLDVLLTTGVDPDDIGGAGTIVERYRPGAVGQPGLVARSDAFHRYLRAVVRADLGDRFYRVTNRTQFSFGSGTVSVLAPPGTPLNEGRPGDNVVVLAYDLRGSRVLLLGDASPAEQRWLRNRSESSLRSSVVVVDDASVPTEPLLRAADPELVIVGGNGSASAAVPSGPWTVRRTAMDGAVSVTVPLDTTSPTDATPPPGTTTRD